MKGEESMAEIPEFESDQEAAEFWGNHSLDEFAENLEPFKLKFSAEVKESISLSLDQEDFNLLKKLAADRGLGHSALARIWVREKLHEVQRRA